MSDESAEKKIIVDEDWKSQIESDREEMRQAGSAEASPSDPGAQLPPPSFESIVLSIATQAIGCLGQMADEEGNPIVDLGVGKHMIDTLSMLEDKTKGNLTTEEASMLENVKHQLHMLYVDVSSAATASPAADTPDSESGIILP